MCLKKVMSFLYWWCGSKNTKFVLNGEQASCELENQVVNVSEEAVSRMAPSGFALEDVSVLDTSIYKLV